MSFRRNRIHKKEKIAPDDSIKQESLPNGNSTSKKLTEEELAANEIIEESKDWEERQGKGQKL